MPYTVLCALACSTCFYRGMSNFTKFPKIISFFFSIFPPLFDLFWVIFLCLMYLGCLWLQITKIIPFLGSPRKRRVGGEAMSPCVYALYLQTVPPTIHSGASSSRVLGCGFNHAWWEKTTLSRSSQTKEKLGKRVSSSVSGTGAGDVVGDVLQCHTCLTAVTKCQPASVGCRGAQPSS